LRAVSLDAARAFVILLRMTNPKISVVVPAHDEERLLPACLDALIAQEYDGPIEIIVVDNASRDRTAAIARNYGVTVVSEPRRDYCYALTCGFAAASGEIIACTDADTIVPRDWIARFVAAYQAAPDVVAVGGRVEFDRPNWKGWVLARCLVPAYNSFDRRDPGGPHLWGANMSVRRDAFVAVGGWNQEYSLQVDSELSERLRRAGRVVLLDTLEVRTSTRRWNQALAHNLYVYISNFLWVKCFRRPLRRDFPVIREQAAPATRTHRGWIVAGLGVAFAFIATIALLPQSSAFGKTYWHSDTREKIVALTFDDGPNEPYTSQVLAILQREHVHATFFLIGENVRRFPDAAARIAEAGHVIGNHTDTHPAAFALSPVSRIQAELSAAEWTIHEATGEFPSLFRPPQGIRSPWLMQTVRSNSLIAVTWDDAPADWNPEPSAVLVERTVKSAHPGAIILLHDGLNTDHAANQSETVQALPVIIERLRAEGYRFVTVPELLHCRATLRSQPPVQISPAVPAATSNGRRPLPSRTPFHVISGA
jgi:peptidoglycan-N-acetylglucosamine deacetylase